MNDEPQKMNLSDVLKRHSTIGTVGDVTKKLKAKTHSSLITGLSSQLEPVAMPKLKIPRSLRNLDGKGQFKDFDVDELVTLKKQVQQMNAYSDEENVIMDKVEDVLDQYIKDFKEFKRLNDDQLRTITMKKAELELEHENHVLKLMTQEAEAKLQAKYDWREKGRHLFIKSLGTALFIGLLLFVGWLVKTYEWAELPYSSVFKSIVPFPKP